jgi:hypothetical protein
MFSLLLTLACGNKTEVVTPMPVSNQNQYAGYPSWITDPYAEKDFAKEICASGRSDRAVTNVDAAKIEAQMIVKRDITTQVETYVGSVQEKFNESLKESTQTTATNDDGTTSAVSTSVSDTDTLKSAQRDILDKSITNLRFLEYVYYPNPMEPTRLFVYGCLSADNVDPLIAAELKKQVMRREHDQAMDRMDEIIDKSRKNAKEDMKQ